VEAVEPVGQVAGWAEPGDQPEAAQSLALESMSLDLVEAELELPALMLELRDLGGGIHHRSSSEGESLPPNRWDCNRADGAASPPAHRLLGSSGPADSMV